MACFCVSVTLSLFLAGLLSGVVGPGVYSKASDFLFSTLGAIMMSRTIVGYREKYAEVAFWVVSSYLMDSFELKPTAIVVAEVEMRSVKTTEVIC